MPAPNGAALNTVIPRSRASANTGAAELSTTFASHFTEEISLDQVLDLDVLRRYARTATGEKFLIVP